jgi:PAS domain S-box-containing protein
MNLQTPYTITEDCLSGYHRFCLEQPCHLDYASSELCSILGYSPDDIHNLFHDLYSPMVYEKDRKKFLDYMATLASQEQTLTLQYRMVCKDGHVIWLQDTTTSRRLEDGQMYGYSVVADITDTHDISSSGFLIPYTSQLMDAYGLLKFTCERYPKIIQCNQQMSNCLGLTDQTQNWFSLLKENIYFMIPFEERDLFQHYMEEVMKTGQPVRVDHHLVRSDDSRIFMAGWMSITTNAHGEKEFILVYLSGDTDFSGGCSIKKSSYFHALEAAYNTIFEINFRTMMFECIGGRNNDFIGALSDAKMTLESAVAFWLNYVVDEDYNTTKEYFSQITNPKYWENAQIYQSNFRLHWRNNQIHMITSIAIKMDPSIVLFCCQDMTNFAGATLPNDERVALDRTQHWIEYRIQIRHALGLMYIEECGGVYTLLYANRSICEYLNLTDKAAYLQYIAGERSFAEILAIAEIPHHDFLELLHTGSLTYQLKHDLSAAPRQVILKSAAHPDKNRVLYEIWVYENESSLQQPEQMQQTQPLQQSPANAPNAKNIFARTFGHFDLFVDNRPVIFSSEKEKELMALLIDRNGGTVAPNEAISCLWEDTELTSKVSARYRKVAMGLKNTLDKNGIGYLLINNHGVRSVNTSALTCDYYELLAGNEEYRAAFHNSYMTNYSWAEDTLASLWDYS